MHEGSATRNSPSERGPICIGLFHRPRLLTFHPGESLKFSFQGECLGRKFPMLQRVPIALRYPATGAVHPVGAMPPSRRRAAL
jgi:hypothetical protein